MKPGSLVTYGKPIVSPTPSPFGLNVGAGVSSAIAETNSGATVSTVKAPVRLPCGLPHPSVAVIV